MQILKISLFGNLVKILSLRFKCNQLKMCLKLALTLVSTSFYKYFYIILILRSIIFLFKIKLSNNVFFIITTCHYML